MEEMENCTVKGGGAEEENTPKIVGAYRTGVKFEELTEEQQAIVREIVLANINKYIEAGEPQKSIQELKQHFIEKGYAEDEIEITQRIEVNVDFDDREAILIFSYYVTAKTEHTEKSKDILNTSSFVAIPFTSTEFTKERNAKGERLYEIYKQKIEEERARKEAEEKAKEEAKRRALEQIEWVKKLVNEINIEQETEKERQRFLKKFQITEDFITDEYEISNKPFIRIQAEIDLSLLGIDRKLKIYNYIFEDSREDEDYQYYNFSDLSKAIAEKLAKIFNGEVIVRETDGTAYLNVETEHDTINIASIDVYDC